MAGAHTGVQIVTVRLMITDACTGLWKATEWPVRAPARQSIVVERRDFVLRLVNPTSRKMHCVERMMSLSPDNGVFQPRPSTPGVILVDSKTRVPESSLNPLLPDSKKRVKPSNEDWLSEIPYAPVYTPSLAEFADPVLFLRGIESEALKFGMCKIQVPEHFRTHVNDLPDHLRHFSFTAREQKLREHHWDSFNPSEIGIIYEHEKPFKIKEFKKCVEEASEKLVKDSKLLPPSFIESEFWRLRNSTESKDVFILYGNDVEGTAFDESDPSNVGSTSWNLQKLAKASWSLLQHTPVDYPGVTTPMLYIGSLFSTFFWHVEDHWMHSINFSHHGAIKTWYGIPPSHAEAFEQVVFDKVYKTAMQDLRKRHSKDPEFIKKSALKQLLSKNTLFHPKILLDAGIPVYKLDQYPGDFIITFPRAYHSGFSHGFNVGEAVNFALPEWLEIGKICLEKYCQLQIPQILPHQMLALKSAAMVFDRMKKDRTHPTEVDLCTIRHFCQFAKEHETLRSLIRRKLIEVELEQPMRNYVCFLCFRQVTGAFVRHRETNGVRCMQCSINACHIDHVEWDLALPQVVKIIRYLHLQLKPYCQEEEETQLETYYQHPLQIKIPKKPRSRRLTGTKRKLRPAMIDQSVSSVSVEDQPIKKQLRTTFAKRDVLRVVEEDWISIGCRHCSRMILEDEENRRFVLGEDLLRALDAPIKRPSDIDRILLSFLKVTDPDAQLVKRPCALPTATLLCTLLDEFQVSIILEVVSESFQESINEFLKDLWTSPFKAL